MKFIFNNIENLIMVIALPLMLFFVFFAILARNLDLFSMSWADEASRFLMIWLAFTGSSYLFKTNGHLGVSFIVELLPKKIQMVLFSLRSGVMILFSLFILYYGTQILISQFQSGQVSPNLDIAMWIVYSALPFLGLFSAIRIVQMTFNSYKTNNFDTSQKEEGIEV